MPIDASIYGQFAPPVQSVPQIQNALVQNQLAQSMMRSNALQFQQQQADFADTNNLRAVLRGGADPSTPEGLQAIQQAAPLQAGKFLQAQSDLLKSRAETSKFAAQGNEANQKVVVSKLDLASRQLGSVNTPDDATAFINHKFDDPTLGPMLGGEPARQAELAKIAAIGNDPAGLAAWKNNAYSSALDAKDVVSNATTQRGQDMTQQTAFTTTGMNNKTTLQAAAGNNAATLGAAGIGASSRIQAAKIGQSTQLAVAGLSPDGTFNANGPGVQGLVDALGQNKLSASVDLQRMPAGMKGQVLAAVQAKYPNWSEQGFVAKQEAAKDFSTGPLGMNVQSANTAMDHAETLRQLLALQGNSASPAFNKLANYIAKQTGQAAPSNVETAIEMLGPELTRAVVGAGGGVGDRGDMKSALQLNGSPQQQLGSIDTAQRLLAGRLSELQRTYTRTTGGSGEDFTGQFLSPKARQLLSTQGPSEAPGAAGSQLSVKTPDGMVHSFPTPAALAKFKAAAGLN